MPSQKPNKTPLGRELAAELARIAERGLSRRLRRIDGPQTAEVVLEGRTVLLLCSNNYLGLAGHPDLIAAAADATSRLGTSAVSSRLVSGHMSAHQELEDRLAGWKRQERALLFSTGYQANIGVVSTLAGPGDVVISDELNHASIIDGCRLSRAEVLVYRHNDMDELADRLTRARGARRVLVVTEAVFSMDGDRAPLAEITELAKTHRAWLMVDEAHSAGVFGPRGAGLAAALGLEREIDIHMGTLGKALGSFGAYVAGPAELVDTLINKARSFIFTTGLPPSAAAAAMAALDVIEREPERATGLLERAGRLGRSLRSEGLVVGHLNSQILPVMVGEPELAVALADELLERGLYVAAIRPPTVPEGSSRLRLSLMATHSDEQIELAGREIAAAAHRLGVAKKAA